MAIVTRFGSPVQIMGVEFSQEPFTNSFQERITPEAPIMWVACAVGEVGDSRMRSIMACDLRADGGISEIEAELDKVVPTWRELQPA